MNISDEILMAYADGELDATQRAQVEQAMAQDPQLAARVQKQRALQQRLHTALDGVLTEPVPERLLAAVQSASRDAPVVDLQAHRASKQPGARRAWGGREWAAMAACWVAGIGLGTYVLDFDGALIASRDGAMIASGRLAAALDQQLASTQSQDDAVHIGLSFKDHSGHYCRSFVVREQQSLAGVACNTNDDWRVHMLTESAANGSEYRQAGSDLPPQVSSLIEQQIAGDALNAEQEAAARNAGWKAP